MSKEEHFNIQEEDFITMTKNIVKTFIKARMNKYDYDRMVIYNKTHGFVSYEKFIEHNNRCVDESSKDDIIFMSMIIDRINKNKINLCDKEDFIEWYGNGFYFNINNELVMTHPQ